MSYIFDHCKTCQNCCQTEVGDGFEIFLTTKEQKELNRTTIIIDGKCQYLGKRGCTLKTKPSMCQVYPLVPHKEGWTILKDCALAKEYVKQLKDPTSSASKHLASTQKKKLSQQFKNQISEYYNVHKNTKVL